MNNTQEVLNVKVRLIFLLCNHHNKTKGNKSYHLFIIHYFADKLIISNIRSTNYRTDTQIVTKKAMKSIIHSIMTSKDGKGYDEEADRRSATADVASPRPREVGGACRIQVLAIARTQETVGGPNGATRSEFRRDRLPVGVTQVRGAHLSRQWCQA